MTLISDMLLIAGALGVAFYCVILSRRLTRFTNLEKGMGGAIAVLSAQVDDMTCTLQAAQTQAAMSGQSLEELTARAEEVARRLELHVASMHDLTEQSGEVLPDPPIPFRRPEPEPNPQEAAPQPRVSGSPPVQSFFSTHRHPPSGATQ